MSGRKWPILLFIALVYFTTAFGGLHARVTDVQVTAPRPAGWILGDIIPLTIDIDSTDATLQRASLPQPGPINYWLDLRSIEVAQSDSDKGTHYTLTLKYQTFYVPLDVNRRDIPALDILFGQGAQSSSTRIPAQVFYMSPLRGVAHSGISVAEQIQPDTAGLLIDEKRLWTAIAALGVFIVLLLVALAVYYCIWPFHQRQAKPFARAYRMVRKQGRAAEVQAYRESLIQLHRAFDACNDGRLLASDVSDFVARHAGLQPLQKNIQQFFSASAYAFFGDDHERALSALPRTELRKIAGQLAAAERKGL